MHGLAAGFQGEATRTVLIGGILECVFITDFPPTIICHRVGISLQGSSC